MDEPISISKQQILLARNLILEFQKNCKHLRLVQINYYNGDPSETITTRICTNCGITEICGEEYSSQFNKLNKWEMIASVMEIKARPLGITPKQIWLPLDDDTLASLTFNKELPDPIRPAPGSPGSGM